MFWTLCGLWSVRITAFGSRVLQFPRSERALPSCSHGTAALKPLLLLQLELQSQEMLAKHWRHLAKKEAKAAKAAKEAGMAHTPAADTPEATFLPRLLSDFLQVRMPIRGVIIPWHQA